MALTERDILEQKVEAYLVSKNGLAILPATISRGVGIDPLLHPTKVMVPLRRLVGQGRAEVIGSGKYRWKPTVA